MPPSALSIRLVTNMGIQHCLRDTAPWSVGSESGGVVLDNVVRIVQYRRCLLPYNNSLQSRYVSIVPCVDNLCSRCGRSSKDRGRKSGLGFTPLWGTPVVLVAKYKPTGERLIVDVTLAIEGLGLGLEHEFRQGH